MKLQPIVMPLVPALALLAALGCGGHAVRSAAAVTPPRTPAADAPVLAISSLKAQNTPANEAAMVTDLLRKELMATGHWRVIDRESMDAAVGAQALALAGGGSDADAANLGKLLNARLIGVGTYGSLMGATVVTFRIVDVETGLATNAGTAEGKTSEEVRASLARMVGGFK